MLDLYFLTVDMSKLPKLIQLHQICCLIRFVSMDSVTVNKTSPFIFIFVFIFLGRHLLSLIDISMRICVLFDFSVPHLFQIDMTNWSINKSIRTYSVTPYRVGRGNQSARWSAYIHTHARTHTNKINCVEFSQLRCSAKTLELERLALI